MTEPYLPTDDAVPTVKIHHGPSGALTVNGVPVHAEELPAPGERAVNDFREGSIDRNAMLNRVADAAADEWGVDGHPGDSTRSTPGLSGNTGEGATVANPATISGMAILLYALLVLNDALGASDVLPFVVGAVALLTGTWILVRASKESAHDANATA